MLAKPRILVAEDDSGIRDLLRGQLMRAGYEVHTVPNGVEGVQKFSTLRPDAMILDINMPQMDGFGVLEHLRPQLAAWRTPVLILTARHAAEDVRRAVGLGAKDYLTKPFSEGQLLARVARLLRPPIPPPAPETHGGDALMLE